MFSFKKGQRWISEMEPELGLGTLHDIEDNKITINFTGSDCTRLYALRTAPLKRVKFKAGDEIITSLDKKYIVSGVEEKDSIFYYQCEGETISEKDLSDTMSFTSPKDRLFTGLFDLNKNYNLRYFANLQRFKLERSDVSGFIGGKIDLIPHQFYIANAVSQRFIPRVLLSDETGLGKTIEACLIINRLLLSDQITRVLILVPDSLVHQWVIELYRRFNLSFTIVSDDFLKNGDENPFTESQTAICSYGLISKNHEINEKIIEAKYDLVVVDEAHHLKKDTRSYSFIKQLTIGDTGLILLSATPEQLGEENHFNHLSLLDPARYSSFKEYKKESHDYKKTVLRIEKLRKNGREEEIEELLDQSGPGRAVFRNTRETIKGFPKREGVYYPLRESDIDPKLEWLLETLSILKDEKTLLICESKERYIEIESYLSSNTKINIAKFNEDMTILQRDRSAAWFSEKDGASVLICSKIGGEGRNFQFAANLIMTDLPLNPELIEQRIGRLDRIGQENDIKIHIPYISDTSDAILVKWYKSVGLFEHNINGIHQIFLKFKDEIVALMEETEKSASIDRKKLLSIVERTSEYKDVLLKKLKDGKDILLELNSFRPEVAKKLIGSIKNEDSQELDDFMIRVFDFFMVPYEDTIKRTYKLYLSKVASGFPKPPMKQKVMDITFDRDIALKRDDIDYISLDHPMVSNCIDLLLGGEAGNTTVCKMDGEPGILLESVYIFESIAPVNIQLKRYLPKTPLRVVTDHNFDDVTDRYSFEAFMDLKEGDKSILNMPQIKERVLPELIRSGLKIAEKTAEKLKAKAMDEVHDKVGREAKRLSDLQRKNPGIRDEEIIAAKSRTEKLCHHISEGRLRLDALRVILVQ